MASHTTHESVAYLTNTYTLISFERRDKLSQGLSQVIAKKAKRWGRAVHDFKPGPIIYRRKYLDVFMNDLRQYSHVMSLAKDTVTVFSEDITEKTEEIFQKLGLKMPPKAASKEFKNRYSINPTEMISNRDEVLEWFSEI
jgi:hypothetical protein